MILKITNDFNLILNKDDYQAFVNAIDLLSLHCPVCGVVGLVTLDENDDLITSFEVALQTIRKVKARVIEFWDSLFPDWRDFKQDDLKIESLKRHNILFGSTRSYCKLCVLSPTGSQL